MAIIHLTQNDWEKEVNKANKPVLVDFFAEWCGPCKLAAPVLEELSTEYEGKLVIGKVDVDEEGELAGKYGVMSIPTVVMFKDGKELERKIGFGGKSMYEEMIKKAI